MPTNLLDRVSRATAHYGLAHWLRDVYLLVRRILGRMGFQLIFSTYDSPIPQVNQLESEFFSVPSPMRGIDFNLERSLELLETELAGFCREFDPPLTASEAGSHRFYLRNGTYESVDAELLYAVIRWLQPRRVVELGSGFSTLIIDDALKRGGAGGDVLRTYDPYRSPVLPPDVAVEPLSVQDVPDDVFTELRSGDVLFVDTSHTVKVGGDVNRIVLELLPILSRGAVVHFHDIFLPYPYSKGHLDAAHFWNEQYLLQAFLSGNPEWEVLLPAQALARAHPERLAAVIRSFEPGVSPGAFWIRRR